jgi:hypothetical protein
MRRSEHYRHSIISSARPSSGSGTVTLSGVAEKTSSRTLLRSQHKY